MVSFTLTSSPIHSKAGSNRTFKKFDTAFQIDQ